jgi:uroporphyrinogen decarboxylase
MPTETMTPHERWLAVLRHQQPDRTPMDYWATREVDQMLMRHLGCANRRQMLKKLHVDFVLSVEPEYVGPRRAPSTDVFGVRYTDADYGGGVYAEATCYPLAGYTSPEEIERHYAWPRADWWSYRDLARQLHGYEEYPVRAGGSEPFLTYTTLRGREQAYLDLIESPEIVEYCLERLFDLAYQNTLRCLEALPGRVTFSYVAEDLGGQTSLLYAPAHIRRFFFPGMKRMIDLVHGAGAYVFHHDDGNITRILPELVDLGIDLLNPIQWRASGMDRGALKSEYGDRLVFHGAMDNQQTLPFGTVDEVRAEVRENLCILGRGGGYILAPCHNLQAVTPVENILAMYATGYAEGWT